MKVPNPLMDEFFRFGLSKIPVIIATTNHVKIARLTIFLNHIAKNLPIEFVCYTLDDLGIKDDNCPEIYYTFEGNSNLKNDYFYYMIREHVESFKEKSFLLVTNDAGLSIPVLENWPNVHTKRCWMNYPPEENITTSAQAIIHEASKLDPTHRFGYFTCATTVSICRNTYLSKGITRYVPAPLSRDVLTMESSQMVKIVTDVPLEEQKTAWDVCAPLVNQNEECNRTYRHLTYFQLVNYGDPMYKSLESVMNRFLGEDE